MDSSPKKWESKVTHFYLLDSTKFNTNYDLLAEQASIFLLG